MRVVESKFCYSEKFIGVFVLFVAYYSMRWSSGIWEFGCEEVLLLGETHWSLHGFVACF